MEVEEMGGAASSSPTSELINSSVHSPHVSPSQLEVRSSSKTPTKRALETDATSTTSTVQRPVLEANISSNSSIDNSHGSRSSSVCSAHEDDAHLSMELRKAQAEAEQEVKDMMEASGDKKEETIQLVPTLLRGEVSASNVGADSASEGGFGRKKDHLMHLLARAERYKDFISSRQAGTLKEMEAVLKKNKEEKKKEEEKAEQEAEENPRASKRRRGKAKPPAKKGRKEGDQTMEEQIRTANEATSNQKQAIVLQPTSLVGGTLKDYQLEGLQFLITLWENGLSGILADEMGLGKTIQVIAFIAWLHDMKTEGPFLIAAPLATLPNWVLEFQKWVKDMPVLLYHGSKDERERLRYKHMSQRKIKNFTFPVIVTSYEICIVDRPHLDKFAWQVMVVDEGQRIKNRESRLFKELSLIPSGTRFLLSGTPIQNSLEELWSLLHFVQPNIFDDLEIFKEYFGFQDIGRSTTVQSIIDVEERDQVVTKLHEILRPFLLRRIKKDVEVSVPPKKEIVVYATMTELQHNYIHFIRKGQIRNVLVEAGIPDAERMSQINSQMNQRKVCNHPFLLGEPLDKDGEPIAVAEPRLLIDCSGKLQLLDRMLRKLHKGKHRVLIFSQMTEMLTILEDYLRYRKWQYRRIDGSVKVLERQQSIEDFNSNKDIFVFLLSTRAGGLGINLAGADTVILYDSDWNPHQDLQAQDRCHRIGQTKPVAVYRLLTMGSVEIEMMDKQISKKKLERLSIVGGDYSKVGKRSRGEMSTDTLKALLSDDVKDLQKRGTTENDFDDASSGITNKELNLVLDRVKMFKTPEEGGLPEEGEMYDVVHNVESIILSSMH